MTAPLHPTDAAPPHPTLAEATAVWARIGLLSFGGPAGQIALMHRELVDQRRWISDARFLHALNFCMLLPGPEAQQLATYIGWLLHGTRGGLIAGTLFVLPGFVVILALSMTYALFNDATVIASLFFGLKAAVLAVVVEALLRIGRRALRTPTLFALALLAFVAIYGFGAPFPLIILSAGLIGAVGVRLRPGQFPAGGHGKGDAPSPPSVIDFKGSDITPSLTRTLRILSVGAVVWGGPVVLVAIMFGAHSVFLPIADFFSRMAVVTFGGAYAVLSYVAQQAVETYRWLEPGEMLDGLALAETTPGPLILVLTYVGFLAAFRAPGGLDPLSAGLIGATLTTWVTFVPCFLWIFLGAPHIERLRHNRAIAAAMSAITASVVGVILNLTLWFALHVLFTRVAAHSYGPLKPTLPDLASLDPAALGVAVLAMLLLFRVRTGVPLTLGICALAGLGLGLGGPG